MLSTSGSTKKKKKTSIRKSARGRLKDLQGTLRIAMTLLDEKTGGDLKEAANLTGLSVATLQRVLAETFSLRIQYRTVQSICLASGYMLKVSDEGETYLVINGKRNE